MRSEAKEWVVLRLLEQSSARDVNKMVPSGMEHVGARGFCPGTRKTVLEGLYYRTVFRGDELVKRSVLKELKLTVGAMLQ